MATASTVSLKPAQVNLAGIRAGDRNLLRVIVRSAGVPLNLSGVAFTATARTTVLATEQLDSICTVDPDRTLGVVWMRWPGEDVRTWLDDAETKSGVWDLQMVATGNEPITVAAGTFAAEQDVTR